MKYLPRKESSARRRAKASRATEMGVAGHAATMKALGNAAGWKAPVASSNVLVIPEILGGKKGLSLYPNQEITHIVMRRKKS